MPAYGAYRRFREMLAMFRRRLFLISSTMASFITPFISVAVNVALPTVAKSFNVDMAFVNWFANVFLMSMASTILFLGVVADWLGRELMFVVGASIFMATAFLVLCTGNFALLLVLRFIQGLGAAMISGTSVAILASLFPEKTGLVIGLNTASVYLGTTLGPVLGGFLVDYAGWASLFTLSGAVAVVSVIIALFSLDFTRRVEGKRPYFQTLTVITTSTILVVFGSTYVGYAHGLAALFLGLTAFIFALHVEHKRSLNLVRRVFERDTFLAYTAALLNYVATFGLPILFSNYLQLEAGFTAREAGLILLAQPLPQMILSPLTGYLADRTNPGILATVGMGLIVLGIGVSIATHKWLNFLILSLILLGIGFAFFASPNTTQIIRKIPREALASSSSFLGLMRFLGQSLSTSILTATMLTFKTSIPMESSLTTYMTIATIGATTAMMSVSREKHKQQSNSAISSILRRDMNGEQENSTTKMLDHENFKTRFPLFP